MSDLMGGSSFDNKGEKFEPNEKKKVKNDNTVVRYGNSGNLFSSIVLFFLVVGLFSFFIKGYGTDFDLKEFLHRASDNATLMKPINEWINFDDVTKAISRLNALWSGSLYPKIDSLETFFKAIPIFLETLAQPFIIMYNCVVVFVKPIFYAVQNIILIFQIIFG